MSWIVQALLSNSLMIREQGDIYTDEFDDLISVETCLNSKIDGGEICGIDKDIILLFKDGKNILDISILLGISRATVTTHLDHVSEILASYLGDSYTDSGYLEAMRLKYNLEDSDVEKLADFIESKYRHKMPRKRRI